MRTMLLGLWLAVGSALVWSAAAGAQVAIDANACQKVCMKQKAQCISACSDDDNPVECEGGCEDEAEDCLARCD